MKVERFNVNDHYAQLASWYVYRRQPPPSLDYLPVVGFFIEDVACCFMYQTDSKLVWMEGAISNPLADKQRRNEALDMIAVSIFDEAKRLGFKMVYGISKLDVVKKRAKRHGGVSHAEAYALIKRGL